MDFDQMPDGAIVPDMSIDDLPSDAVITLLNPREFPPHIAVSSAQARRRWEYRREHHTVPAHHWRTWQCADSGWYTDNGSPLSRNDAQRLVMNTSPVHPLLRVPDGL